MKGAQSHENDRRGNNNLALNLGSIHNQNSQNDPSKKSQLNTNSQISLSSSYQVPALDGKLLQAIPIKLCLKFRPPTIAVVYKLDPIQRTIQSTKSSKRHDKKYIHEIIVDQITKRTDLQQLCDKLCEKENQYLNPTVISKTQVLELLTKLYEKEHGPVSKPATKEPPVQTEKSAPQPQSKEKQNEAAAPANKRSKFYNDDFEDDFLDQIPTLKDADPFEKQNQRKDIFDTSKEKIKQQAAEEKPSNKQFLDSSSGKKKDSGFDYQQNDDEEEEDEEYGDMREESQEKQIEQQFKTLYDGDPDLRKVLEKSDVNTFSVEEKLQIIEAYMQGGGAAGLQIELQEDEEEEMDEQTLEQMSKEDKRALEQQFMALYKQDPVLKQVLGSDPANLTLFQKYQVMLQYQRAGETSQINSGGADDAIDESSEIIMHEGKMYRRVQIEGADEEYLMDEEQNIYDMNLKQVGKAGDDDDNEF